MKLFEYKIESLNPKDSTRDLVRPITTARVKLEALGKEGFELVTIVDNVAYLKKEVTGMSFVEGGHEEVEGEQHGESV